MSEENKTAETSVEESNIQEIDNNTNVDEVADINKEQSEVNDFEFTDTKDVQNDDSDKSSVKKYQSAEKNSEFARKRREAEMQSRLAKAEEESRIKTLIEFTDGINPYTQEPINDKIDVQKYLAMREIEKNGGDPIGDYHKVQSKKQKEEVEAQKKIDEEKQWYANDRKEFFNKHPELKDSDLSEILQNEQFLLYGEGKFGKMPLAEIYDGYNKVVSTFESKAKSMAEQLYANRQSSPGPLNSSEVSKAKTWDDMTPAEFEKAIQEAKNGKYKQT